VVVSDPGPHLVLHVLWDVDLAVLSVLVENQIERDVLLAFGAFAAWLAAGSLSNGKVTAEEPFSVDELGELGPELPLALRHLAARWGPLNV